VAGIVAAYVVINFYRDASPRPRVSYSAKDRSYLSLTARDDYAAVVRKLGAPARMNRPPGSNAVPYLVLSYPERGYSVMLSRGDGGQSYYACTIDDSGRTLHSANNRRAAIHNPAR
jgi:hypothetical protein